MNEEEIIDQLLTANIEHDMCGNYYAVVRFGAMQEEHIAEQVAEAMRAAVEDLIHTGYRIDSTANDDKRPPFIVHTNPDKT